MVEVLIEAAGPLERAVHFYKTVISIIKSVDRKEVECDSVDWIHVVSVNADKRMGSLKGVLFARLSDRPLASHETHLLHGFVHPYGDETNT
jgi:hypothetical protein